MGSRDPDIADAVVSFERKLKSVGRELRRDGKMDESDEESGI